MIIDKNNTKLFCYMDDTCCPYEEGECPFPRTLEDDEFDRKMIEKYGLNKPEHDTFIEQENPVYYQQD